MTYSIARYPVELIDVVSIDGSRIVIRPTLPQDSSMQSAFFRSLSPESRYYRFMSRVRELPEPLVERFAKIDYRRHVALLAEVFDTAGHETMIGEARYVVDECEQTTCEFAVAIADDWHARGLALTLLARLENQAVASGLHRMVGDTLITNRAMQALAVRAGFEVKVNREDVGLARLEKVFAAAPA